MRKRREWQDLRGDGVAAVAKRAGVIWSKTGQVRLSPLSVGLVPCCLMPPIPMRAGRAGSAKVR